MMHVLEEVLWVNSNVPHKFLKCWAILEDVLIFNNLRDGVGQMPQGFAEIDRSISNCQWSTYTYAAARLRIQ